ncbi:type VI secretion system protein TssA [Tistrella mobilis]|uniref:type VI secretion system protein TssA n=1 Tax=Tistrella mobilis TaxID=171437 RepID=UPI0031F6DD08
MPPSPKIDPAVQALLDPIAGARPAGEDPREDYRVDAPFRRLKDLRSAARAAERAAEVEDEPQAPAEHWPEIDRLAADLLRHKAKDLEVAGLLIEAEVRLNGFAGLAFGFDVATGLIRDFWDGLWPAPDEEGIASRVRPLMALNGESGDGVLVQAIRKVPVLGPQGRGIALWQIDQAVELGRLEPDRREQRLAKGAASMAMIEAAGREMTSADIDHAQAGIAAARAALARLDAALDQAAGRDAPPLARIRQVLEAAEQGLRLGLGARAPRTPEPVAGTAAPSGDRPAEETAAAPAVAAPVPAGMALPVTAIATREDAFRVIEAVAGWFRTAEPHSPIAYTLDEAVRRGRLPLTDLITELIRDETARRDFLIAAGIKPADAA